MGTHLVVVRYDSLRFDPDNKIVLPGGTKEGLTMLPAFEYAKQPTSAGSAPLSMKMRSIPEVGGMPRMHKAAASHSIFVAVIVGS